MSTTNPERLRDAHDAFNRRDLDAFVALADPEIEISPLIVHLEGITAYRGVDGVRQWWSDMLDVFADARTELDDTLELGDVTVGYGRLQGHGGESDAFFNRATFQVVEWRNGRVLWWRTFLTEAEALEAAESRRGRAGLV
jgi:ketosteroid isomerase-like protein